MSASATMADAEADADDSRGVGRSSAVLLHEPDEGAAGPPPTSALREHYSSLTARLAATRGEPADRWRLLCDLARTRSALRAGGVRPWELGLRAADGDAFARRMSGLLQDIVGHTGSPRLTALVPGLPAPAGALRPLLDELRAVGRAPCIGTYLHGSVDGGYRAVQEDLLTAELHAMARIVGPPAAAVRDVLAELTLLRARETALACWVRFGGLLRSLLPRRPGVVSIGAGLGEFEGTLVRETAARALCVDTDTDTDAVTRSSAHGLSRRRITPLEAYRPLGTDIDLLVLKDVLHHVRQPQWLLVAAARALRPGGVVLAMEPTVPAEDRPGLAALRELDSTPYKNSIVPVELWERWYGHAGLTGIERFSYPPGVLDNNDSFPRTVWLLGRTRGPGRGA